MIKKLINCFHLCLLIFLSSSIYAIDLSKDKNIRKFDALVKASYMENPGRWIVHSYDEDNKGDKVKQVNLYSEYQKAMKLNRRDINEFGFRRLCAAHLIMLHQDDVDPRLVPTISGAYYAVLQSLWKDNYQDLDGYTRLLKERLHHKSKNVERAMQEEMKFLSPDDPYFAQNFSGKKDKNKDKKDKEKNNSQNSSNEESNAFATTRENIVTIQAKGIGSSRENAIIEASRAALRASYGEFISSNITTLDNQIVKEEFASLVSGTVKSYEVLSEFEDSFSTPPMIEVLIEAKVGTGELFKFAKAIGDDVEVQGSLFAAKFKQQILNKKSEAIAMQHLVDRVDSIYAFFDHKLYITEPKRLSAMQDFYYTQVVAVLTTNKNIETFNQQVLKTIKSVSMSGEEVEEYEALNTEYFTVNVYDIPKNCHFHRKESWMNLAQVKNYLRDSNINEKFGKQSLTNLNCATSSKNKYVMRSRDSFSALYDIGTRIMRSVSEYDLFKQSRGQNTYLAPYSLSFPNKTNQQAPPEDWYDLPRVDIKNVSKALQYNFNVKPRVITTKENRKDVYKAQISSNFITAEREVYRLSCKANFDQWKKIVVSNSSKPINCGTSYDNNMIKSVTNETRYFDFLSMVDNQNNTTEEAKIVHDKFLCSGLVTGYHSKCRDYFYRNDSAKSYTTESFTWWTGDLVNLYLFPSGVAHTLLFYDDLMNLDDVMQFGGYKMSHEKATDS
tara:strand:- start:89 stop:2263 length:2175 start_codon:yes stop_codon:yes gene_type:complete